MAVVRAQEASSSSSRFTYDVFLSFRGEDVRKTFVDHLYKAMVQARFRTFRDDDEIKRGENIKLELEESIQLSRISVVVLSKEYAFSSRCLDELLMILDCRRNFGQGVLPVFYHVDPSAVRKQKGRFEEAFRKYEEQFNAETDDELKRERMDKVKRWREALREVADLTGMNIQNQANGHESNFIQKIVEVIADKLNRTALGLVCLPVGIHSRAESINLWVQDESASVNIYVICGMGGIGKTTIAKYIYNLNYGEFGCKSFLANIREISEQPNGLLGLQKQILSEILKMRKIEVYNVDQGTAMIKDAMSCEKVFLVLDDVNEVNQLDALLGTRKFYPGSKIIITTRDKWLLKAHEAHKVYEVEKLEDDESLELFTQHAFSQDHPPEGYAKLLKRVVQHCGGLPLAHKVLGSSLFGKSVDMWESELKKLEAIPNAQILDKLKVSYDSLQDDHDKKLFLHIACFFVGKDKDDTVKILDRCGFFTVVGIENLTERGLITINKDNKLMMHKLIKKMGREIVYRESPKKPEKRSRLWHHKDSFKVLKNKTGTKAIEGLIFDMRTILSSYVNYAKKRQLKEFSSVTSSKQRYLSFIPWLSIDTSSRHSNEEDLKTDAFARMKELKLLCLNYVKVTGGFVDFPKKLRWLSWHGFPLKSIPMELSLTKVVALDMSYSKLEQAWDGIKLLGSLKILNLSYSRRLTRTPDFSALPNVEKLIFTGCVSLVEVCESIGYLEGLTLLDLKDCKSLQKFPNIDNHKFLETLIISGCSSLGGRFPISLSNMKSLKVLNADGIAITDGKEKLWHPFALWKRRKSLEMPSLPGSLVNLSLTDCNLSNDSFPKDFSNLLSLRCLDLSGNPIVSLPNYVRNVSTLQKLYLNSGKSLENILGLPSMELLDVGGNSRLWHHKDSFKDLKKGTVKSLHSFAWKTRKSPEMLPSLPGLTNIGHDSEGKFSKKVSEGIHLEPPSLRELLMTSVLKNTPARFIPTAPFINLVALDMSHNKLEQVCQGIMFLPSLKILNQSHSKYLSRTPDFSGVLNLEKLILQGCARLVKVSESITLVKRLTLLNLEDCIRLTNLPRSITTLPRLETLILSGCSSFEFTTGLGVEWDTKDIKEIHLRNNTLSELPDNPKCPALAKLFLQSNYDLTEIPGTFFEDMPLLQVLDLSNTSIKSLDIPSISRLGELQELLLRGCELLMELPPQIGALRKLKVFDLEGTELVYLPKELGELFNLECLKVSLYGYADSYKESKGIDAIIPRTTLSKLTELKELSINVDPYGEWWNVEVKAIFEELPSLRKLETLKLYVPTAELLQQFLQLEWNVDGLSIYANLSHFRLIVGSQQQRLISRLPHDLEEEFLKLEKCLKYINGEGKTDGLAEALKHANALFLDRHWTIEKLSVFKMDELNELKVCLLVDCNEMQTVFDGSDFSKGGSLQSLLYLGIYYLKNLEFIWKGPVVGSCLPHLKILVLHVCPNLTTIFTPMLLQNLVNLEEIIVDDCPKIETLVFQDSSHTGSDHFLPSLKKLSLLDLPELVKISSDLCIAPNLERMVIYNCPKLKILSSVEVCNKEIMEIKGESEWWNALEWNEPEWSIGQPDYLCRAFKELDVEKDLMDQSISSTRIFPNLLMKDREALNSEKKGNGSEKSNGEEKKNNGGGGKKDMIDVVLKIELHCDGCASKVIKCIRSLEGVESVKGFDGDLNKLKVVGNVDPLKLREEIERKTKKKVEILSPFTKKDKDDSNKEKKKDVDGDEKNKKSGDKLGKQSDKKKSKELPVTTTVLKVHCACGGCIRKIHKLVRKTKGFMEMSIDGQKDLVTVKGAIDVKALVEALEKKLKRPVYIVSAKKEGGGEKKEKTDGGNGGRGVEKASSVVVGGGGDCGLKVERNEQHVPQYNPYMYGQGYMSDHEHAPQLFSDENPNACVIV